MRISVLALAAILAASLPTVSGAVVTGSFVGEYWDTVSTRSTSLAINVIESRPPDATFTSTAIDYPQGPRGTLSSRDTINSFLGSDAPSLVSADPNIGSRALEGSVFRFTGVLHLDPGNYLFSVASDDGFWLTLGDQDYGFWTERSYATSYKVKTVAAALPFELIYFEDRGVAGVWFSVDALRSRATGRSTSGPVSSVPLPPALPMTLAALAVLGLVRRRS